MGDLIIVDTLRNLIRHINRFFCRIFSFSATPAFSGLPTFLFQRFTQKLSISLSKAGYARCLFFLFSFSFPFAHADLVDYLKPVTNKPENCDVENVDFIYMINLDARPEKFTASIEQLRPYQIKPCRFSALNGWELDLKAINELGVQYEPWMSSGRWGTFYSPDGDRSPQHEIVTIPGRTYFCHCMALGAIGCTLSHLSVLQDALNSGYETIWVMEDDIEVIQNPHLISELIAELDGLVGKNGWDILFTDQDTKNMQGAYVPCSSYAWRPNYSPLDTARFSMRKDVGARFRQIGSRYGSYSMIIRRSGIKKILNFLKCYQIFLPYDMEYTQPANIKLFALKEDVVSTQPRAPSDNGSPNYSLNPMDSP